MSSDKLIGRGSFDNGVDETDDDTGTDKQPRLSFYYESNSLKQDSNRECILDEIDRVEQLITLNLQKINKNLMNSNNLISNKLIPTLEQFNKNSNNIYNNINHIKEFFENAANVNILTKKDVETQQIGDVSSASYNNSNLNIDSFDTSGINTASGAPGSKDPDNLNISSELSEIRNIKDRYKQNLETSSNKDDITNTNTNTNTKTQTHTTTTLKMNNLPNYFDEQANSVNTETFLKDFEIAAEDESTGRLLKRRHPESREDNNKVDKLQEEEENMTNRYVKNIIAGYESPPWEDPPILESSRFSVSKESNKKRKRRISNISQDRNDETRDYVTADEEEEEEEEEKEEEEEVSIRFPSSPKYGGGGKLLRSDQGRQIALDFARSEMLKNHPILSLNSDKNDNEPISNIDTKVFQKEIYDTSNSTLDDAPELISETLNRRKQRHEAEEE